MEDERIRCKKCRGVLLSENKWCVLDAHGEEHHNSVGSVASDTESSCTSVRNHNCLYLSEESFPGFVLEAIEESCWTKGKIYCPSCQARLGSFNFVSGSQCECGSHVLPQVHILRSKVDWMKVGEALPHPVSFPSQSVVLWPSSLPLDQSDYIPLSEANDQRDASPTASSILSDPAETRDNSSQDNSSRSHVKRRGARQETSSSKLKHRKQSRWKMTADDTGLNGAMAVTPSCFEVLEDELSGLEENSTAEEEDTRDIPDKLMCPVCLDVLYSPLVAKPCGHIFCEPCLRRMARPNPTNTPCPLCRQIIGQCMPCPDLAHHVKHIFGDLYWRRRQFELQHNSQHLPLPWTRNFRLRSAYNSSEGWVERAGGWRTILVMIILNFLGYGIIAYLKK